MPEPNMFPFHTPSTYYTWKADYTIFISCKDKQVGAVDEEKKGTEEIGNVE